MNNKRKREAFTDGQNEEWVPKRTRSQESYLMDLPNDCHLVVLSYLSAYDLITRLSVVNSTFLRLSRCKPLWSMNMCPVVISEQTEIPPCWAVCGFHSLQFRNVSHLQLVTYLFMFQATLKHIYINTLSRMWSLSNLDSGPQWMHNLFMQLETFVGSGNVNLYPFLPITKNLRTLAGVLANNLVTPVHPPEYLSDLSLGLRSNCSTVSVTEFLQNATNLRRLTLIATQLSYSILKNLVCTKLEYLDVRMEGTVQADDIPPLPALKHLKIYINRGNITDYFTQLFKAAPMLQTLDVSLHFIVAQSFGPFDPSTIRNLSTLQVDFNYWYEIDSSLLSVPSLTTVTIKYPKAFLISHFVASLSHTVRELTLHGTKISLAQDTNVMSLIFKHLTALRHLTLYNVSLPDSMDQTCSEPSSLETLDYMFVSKHTIDEEMSLDLLESMLFCCQSMRRVKYHTSKKCWDAFCRITSAKLPHLEYLSFGAKAPRSQIAKYDFNTISILPPNVKVDLTIGGNATFFGFTYLMKIVLSCHRCHLDVHLGRTVRRSSLDPRQIIPSEIKKAIEIGVQALECTDKEKLDIIGDYTYHEVAHSWYLFYNHLKCSDQSAIGKLFRVFC